MKPETISTISKLLQRAVNDKKTAMLRWIESCLNADDVIKEYQELYLALEDFNEWCAEQEGEDGNV